MKFEVYIRGYDDARNSGAGFAELIDYKGNPPPDWILKAFRDLHTKLADRPSVEHADKPAGVLIFALNPPEGSGDETHVALANMKPVTGASGRSGYEILALFVSKSDLEGGGSNWKGALARYWSGVDWQTIKASRKPKYEAGEPGNSAQPQTVKKELGKEDDSWVVKLKVGPNAKLPLAALLSDPDVAARLPDGVNLVVGLDMPLLTPGMNAWRWIKLEEVKPAEPAKPVPQSLKDLIPDDQLRTLANQSVFQAYLAFEVLKHQAEAAPYPRDFYYDNKKDFKTALARLETALKVRQRIDPKTSVTPLLSECTRAENSLKHAQEPQEPQSNGEPWYTWPNVKPYLWTLLGSLGVAILLLFVIWKFFPGVMGIGTAPATSGTGSGTGGP